MPSPPTTRARTPVIVDQDSLTNAIAGIVLDQLRDLFRGVTLTAQTSIPDIRVNLPPLPVPVANISSPITVESPVVNVTPAISIAMDLDKLAEVFRAHTAALDANTRAMLLPVTRTITRDQNGNMTMTERRG